MNAVVQVNADLDVAGTVSVGQFSEFPANPRLGTGAIINKILYFYMELGGMTTWYPFSHFTSSYVHVQGVANATWTVTHNLGTENVWIQVKDESGNILMVSKHDLSPNQFQLLFTAPATGTVLVVAPEAVNVPEVHASSMTIGTNAVVIDSSGVRVNGEYLIGSSAIIFKADLVNGKVPVNQLPVIPFVKADGTVSNIALV